MTACVKVDQKKLSFPLAAEEGQKDELGGENRAESADKIVGRQVEENNRVNQVCKESSPANGPLSLVESTFAEMMERQPTRIPEITDSTSVHRGENNDQIQIWTKTDQTSVVIPPDAIKEPTPEPLEVKPGFLKSYFKKWKGKKRKTLIHHGFQLDLETIFSLVNSLVSISILAILNNLVLDDTDYVMLIGSFGAMAVLLYGAWSSPLAQPRNCIGAKFFAKAIGSHAHWLACGLAVSLAIAAMEITGTVHPPGGATALIAVQGSTNIHALGFMYVLVPIMSGVFIMLLVALVLNNLSPKRSYPTHWW